MKKITLITLLAIAGFSFSAFMKAQTQATSPFEGVITYSISTDNDQAAQMVGTSATFYIKGDKTKQVKDGMFSTMVFEDNNKPNHPVILISAMGNKYLLKNDTTKVDTATPVIKYIDGTKKIAGYMCSKAEVTTTMKGESVTAIVYYTADIVIKQSKNDPFRGLKGFPLEYSVSQQGVQITYSATKVKQQTLTDDVFIPHTSGYKVMTEDEIKEDIQEKMQSGN